MASDQILTNTPILLNSVGHACVLDGHHVSFDPLPCEVVEVMGWAMFESSYFKPDLVHIAMSAFMTGTGIHWGHLTLGYHSQWHFNERLAS